MPTPGNSINEQSASGLVNFNGTATFATTAATQFNVLTGASTNTVNNVAPSATSGVPLISQGSVSQPIFGTAVVAGGGTGDTSFTAYSVITGGTTSTGALQNVSGVGTSGQVLTSNGAGTLPTWQSSTGVTSVVTTNATPQFVLSGGVDTINFAISNLVLGSALPALSGGTFNVGMGSGVLAALTTGSSNTIMGYQSGQNITTGFNNTIVGNQSFTNATTSPNNTVYGNVSLGLLSTGTGFNLALGYEVLSSLQTGSNNTAIGVNAGNAYISAESNNICIGNVGVAAESNVLRIGTSGSGTGQQNKCFIAGISGVTVTGTAVLCSTSGQLGTIASSARYKENIKDMNGDVSILALRPVEFNYKSDNEKTKKYGLIAEEVEKSFPYLVFYNNEKKPESILYHELPVLLLAEIKKLNKRIDILEKSFK